MASNLLSQLGAQSIKKPGRHADGDGLYLEVTDTGAKRWLLRIVASGRRRDFGLGPFSSVPLKLARERAASYRELIFQGIDPVEHRKQQMAPPPPPAPTFASCAREVHKLRIGQMRSLKRKIVWLRQLEQYAFPIIGDKSIAEITTADVMAVLTPIWSTKPETARRVRQRMINILDWAKASGHRTGDNPLSLIGNALPRQRNTVQHLAALPLQDILHGQVVGGGDA